MIRGASILPALLAAVLFAAGPPPASAQAPTPRAEAFDPSDVYFQGWLNVKDAQKLEAKGDFEGALEKLERARQLFDSIARFHPNWKKSMVAGRLESTTEAITRVDPKAREQRAPAERAMAELEGRRLPVDPAGKVVQPAPGRRIPVQPPRRLDDPQVARAGQLQAEVKRLRQDLARNQADSQRLAEELERNRDATATSKMLSQQLKDAEGQRKLLNYQLKQAEEEMNKLRADLASRPVRSEYDRLNAKLEKVDREREATAMALQQSRDARLAAEQKIKTTEADLGKARQQVSDLERNLGKEREVANEVIRGQQQQLRQLREIIDSKDRQLADARSQISQLERTLDETRDAFTELREERDNLLRERDHMAALLKLNEAGRIQELIEQNMSLAKELRLANERFERVKKDSDETKEDYVVALRDLAIAKARIINLQKENRAQHQRLEQLEQRLEQADTELAAGNTGANDEEVAMLRDIIRRQLRIQERRRKARELLLAQVRRLGIEDDKMENAIAMMDDNDLRLTPDEQRVINDREVDGEFVSPFAVSADHRAKAMSRVERERAGFEDAGSRAFTAGRLLAAEELFDSILDLNPGHVPTMQKLGVVRLKRHEHQAAMEVFQDAVALDAENAYARRMLGVCYYKAGSNEEAEKELRHSVAIDPGDGKAQTYLGNTLFRLGRQSEAEQHFKAAITAEPNLSEPYFNLAFLLASDPKRKEEARNYYQQALENGALPDIKLEQRLGL